MQVYHVASLVGAVMGQLAELDVYLREASRSTETLPPNICPPYLRNKD